MPAFGTPKTPCASRDVWVPGTGPLRPKASHKSQGLGFRVLGFRGYIGIMEKKMETVGILGVI